MTPRKAKPAELVVDDLMRAHMVKKGAVTRVVQDVEHDISIGQPVVVKDASGRSLVRSEITALALLKVEEHRIFLGGSQLFYPDIRRMIRELGFADPGAFMVWVAKRGFPFEGVLVKWAPKSGKEVGHVSRMEAATTSGSADAELAG